MISYILIIIASICNAIMDTLSHHHSTSVFKSFKTGFWSDAETTSWKNKYIDSDTGKGRKRLFWMINVPVQFTDAWHFFKSFMITLMIGAVVFYKSVLGQVYDFVLIGCIWNFVFGLFYNHMLIRKK